MKKCPEAAILLAAYNGEKYLSEQLDSLLSQKVSGGECGQSRSLPGTEPEKTASEFKRSDTEKGLSENSGYKIYIHDDGSSDNTVSILRIYAERYPDKIELIEGPPTGGAKNNFFYLMREVACRNRKEDLGQDGSFAGDPQYYFFCDQDDVWLEDKLQTELAILKELEKNGDPKRAEQKELADPNTDIGKAGSEPVPSLVWCDMKVVDENLNVIADSFSSYSNLKPEELSLDRCIMHGKAAGCSIACNAALVKLCCEIDNTQDVIMHDWALFLIARMIGRLQYIDLPLVLYRQHGKNSLGANNEGRVQTALSILGRLLSRKQMKATQVNLKRYIAQVASLKQVRPVCRSEKGLIDGADEFTRMSRMERVRYVNRYQLYRHKHNKLWTSMAAFLMN